MKSNKFIDSFGTKRTGIECKCKHCGKSFLCRKDQPQLWCSRSCSKFGRRTQRTVLTCAQCHNSFERLPTRLNCSRHGIYFCSRKCKDAAQCIGGIKAIQPPHYGTGVSSYREQTLRDIPAVCKRCGYDEFKCAIEVHHIDSNRDNNLPANLVVLCACCHRSLHNNCWQLADIETNS